MFIKAHVVRKLCDKLELPQVVESASRIAQTMVAGNPSFDGDNALLEAGHALERFDLTFKNSDHYPGSTGSQTYNWYDVPRLAKTWCYGSIAGDHLSPREIVDKVWLNRVPS